MRLCLGNWGINTWVYMQLTKKIEVGTNHTCVQLNNNNNYIYEDYYFVLLI